MYRQGDWIAIRATNRLVVAVIGHVNDWAAYEGKEHHTVAGIMATGDKIFEEEARTLFPQLKDYYYRP